jgi:large subunit ribosomal protein L29
VKAQELRQLSEEELLKELASLREARFRLRIRRATGEAAIASEFTRLRREVARILTLLAERERAQASQPSEQGASDNG